MAINEGYLLAQDSYRGAARKSVYCDQWKQ